VKKSRLISWTIPIFAIMGLCTSLAFSDTATDTPTITATPFVPLSNIGNALLGPVPVPRGGNLCLFPDKPISTVQWDVFNLYGEVAARFIVTALSSQPCWSTIGVPPGMYIVRLKLSYGDGTAGTAWQKVVVSR